MEVQKAIISSPQSVEPNLNAASLQWVRTVRDALVILPEVTEQPCIAINHRTMCQAPPPSLATSYGAPVFGSVQLPGKFSELVFGRI